MPQDNAAYRSFTSFRMTGFRFVVILTEGKDLYIASRDNVLKIPQLSVMNPFFAESTFPKGEGYF